MFFKNYRSFLSTIAALLFLTGLSSTAHANIPKKNLSKSSATKPAEVYAATEEDPHTPTLIDTSEPGDVTASEEVVAVPAMMAVPVVMPAPPIPAPKPKLAESVPAATKFDPVPPTRVDSILKRVKLVETILKKYGRAYDYRTVSSQDLEKILAQLESAS